MKGMKLRLAALVLALTGALGSIAVSAHQTEHEEGGMMGSHMEGMAHMMSMMSSLSEEDRAAMEQDCTQMMQDDAVAHDGSASISGHHGSPSAAE